MTESPYDPAVELVEREPYLAALADHLAAAAAGEGRLVVVAAEAGIGKTTLLRAFADEHSDETRIAWGACDGLFTPEPLAPLHDLAGQLGGGLAEALAADAPRRDLFAAAGPPDGGPRRLRSAASLPTDRRGKSPRQSPR